MLNVFYFLDYILFIDTLALVTFYTQMNNLYYLSCHSIMSNKVWVVSSLLHCLLPCLKMVCTSRVVSSLNVPHIARLFSTFPSVFHMKFYREGIIMNIHVPHKSLVSGSLPTKFSPCYSICSL